MIKPDGWIREMVERHQMIEPFEDKQVSGGVVSYGLSSFGYDARLADEFQIASGATDLPLDPKKPDSGIFHQMKESKIIIPPNTFVLARSFEYFRIPRNVLGLCVGKSTYARSGVLINVTPLEPEWEGYVTISITNTTNRPVILHGNEGIMQVLFFESDRGPEISYRDRKGKYQAQKTITISKVQ